MRFSKVRIEFQRFAGCADYFRARLVRRSAEKNSAETTGSNCQADVSRRNCERRLMLLSSFQVNSYSTERAEHCGSNDDTRVAAIQALEAGTELRERRRRAVRYPCSGAIRLAWTSNFDSGYGRERITSF
jgi:hypothetical protein